jgi:membrane-associated phospholipid phosphatase
MWLLRNKTFWFMTIAWFISAAICCHLLDFRLTLAIDHSRPAWLISLMNLITLMGRGSIAAVITIVLCALAYFKRQAKTFRLFVRLLIALALSGIICNVLKIFFGRARPDMWFKHKLYGFYFFKLHASMWSFPSGHCTTAASFFVGLTIIYPRFKWLWLTLMLLVAISRVTLLHHYISDAMIGLWLGTTTTLLLLKPKQ